MNDSLDIFGKIKLNDGFSLACYKIVESIKKNQRLSLKEALEVADVSMESYRAGKKLLDEDKENSHKMWLHDKF